MPCACLSCRQVVEAEACPFRRIRQERGVKVSEQTTKKVKNILKVDKVTRNILVEQLWLRNHATMGTKETFAIRLLAFVASESGICIVCTPLQQPWAFTNINIDSTRLNDAGSDDDDGSGNSNAHLYITSRSARSAAEHS